MTSKEAVSIFMELCAVYRRHDVDVQKEPYKTEFTTWLRHLKTIPFELAEKGLWELERSPKFKHFPRIGEFAEMCQQFSDRYSTEAKPVKRDYEQQYFDIWRHEQIAKLDPVSYWQFCYDEDFQAKKNQEWERKWVRGETI